MRIGISGQALGDVMSMAEIVKIGRRYGVREYEIWPVNAPGEGASYAARDVKTLVQLQRDEDVRIYTVTMGAAFDADSCRSESGYAKLLCEAIDAAAALDAKVVNHYLYWLNMSEVHDYAHLEACWKEPLEHARQAGVRLALENEAHDGSRTPELMRAILDHFDDHFFLTNFDATNYLHASAEGFPAGYEILRDKIGYVHIKNGCLHRYGAGQPEICTGAPMSGHYNPRPIQYTPLPDGAVNIAGLLTRIREDGLYDGVCTFEPHTHTAESVCAFYDREITWLKQLGFME